MSSPPPTSPATDSSTAAHESPEEDGAAPESMPIPRYAEDLPESTLRWNFWGLTLYQVVLRVGWIFKTESIIMPAVLDSLGCGPAVRAWLPLLNRLGQSVPPLLAANRLRAAEYKKRVLLGCSLAMSASFFLLSGAWWLTSGDAVWLPFAFLAIYAVFFVSTGLHQLAFGTLQGKLVPVRRRGRLLMAANIIGATTACCAAAALLPRWLTPQGGAFQYVFAFTGTCFFLAAVVCWMLREQSDGYERRETTTLLGVARGARDVWARDANVRRLAVVGALFGVRVVLFPHYQALARDRLGLSYENMMLWVVLQNSGTALFSFVIGPLADRRGNRLVLIFVLSAISICPLLAVGLSYAGEMGARLYPLVFLSVGLTPNVLRTLNNYTLEISEPADHPRFLSTLNLFIGASAFLSPAVGWVIPYVGMDSVFYGATVFLLAGWILSFGLKEPRDHEIPGSP